MYLHKKSYKRSSRRKNLVKRTLSDLSSKNRAAKIILKKESIKRKRDQRIKQAEKEIDPLKIELLVARINNESKSVLREMQTKIDKEMHKILSRGPGKQKKKFRKLAHKKKLEKAKIIAAFNEAECQRNIRRYLPKENVQQNVTKVVDLIQIQVKQTEYKVNSIRRNFSKLRNYIERSDADSIKVFLKLLHDVGIKSIPTDIFFSCDNFEDIVLKLLIENNVAQIPIRKYQKMV